jgi:hypothetical protein
LKKIRNSFELIWITFTKVLKQFRKPEKEKRKK